MLAREDAETSVLVLHDRRAGEYYGAVGRPHPAPWWSRGTRGKSPIVLRELPHTRSNPERMTDQRTAPMARQYGLPFRNLGDDWQCPVRHPWWIGGEGSILHYREEHTEEYQALDQRPIDRMAAEQLSRR